MSRACSGAERGVADGLPGRPRILIAGAGGLGSVVGGLLARSGLEVELLAREAHARTIRARRGLELEEHGTTTRIPVQCEWRPARLQPADVVIVAAKAPDTEALLASLTGQAESVTVALSLQNGIEKDALLSAWCGPERVIGATTMVGGELVAPGRVRHTLSAPTLLGELDGVLRPRVEALAAHLSHAGLPATVVDDIRSAEWAKLAMAAPAQAVAALTRRPYHEVLGTPELARVVARLTRECTQVAAAAGVTLRDWPALSPTARLSQLSLEELSRAIEAQGRELEAQGLTQVRPSMLQSLERGRRLEVEALQGFVAREARAHAVAAPVTEICHELLAGIDRHLANRSAAEACGAG